MTHPHPEKEAAAARLRRKNYAVLFLVLAAVVLFFVIGIIRMGSPLQEGEKSRLERYQRFEDQSPHESWSPEESESYFRERQEGDTDE